MFAQAGWVLTVFLSWLSHVQGNPARQQPAAQLGGPCDAGDWGYVSTNPLDAIHVRETGDDLTGDGSEALPFATVQRAVDAARLRPVDSRKIAVGPGEFKDTRLLLDRLDDDGLVIEGCGPDQTVLDGEKGLPVLDLATNGEIHVAGVTLEDGRDTLTIRDGAMARVRGVDIAHADDRGVVVSGLATMAWFEDVNVDKTKKGDLCGWGVDVQDAMLFWFGGSIRDSRALGLFAQGADVVLDGVTIDDVNAHTDGTLGRGVHAQDSWSIVTDGVISGIADAGVFLLWPRGGLIGNIIIDNPGAGVIAPGGPPQTGDGIVVTGLATDAMVFLVENTVEDAPRAATLMQDIRAVIGYNVGINTGLYPVYGADQFRQGVTSLLGPDALGVVDLSATPEPVNDAWVTCVP